MPKTKVSCEIITSDTLLVPDQWLYHWSGDPPREFLLHKTLFRPLSPVDIVANGWQVLIPAVTELAASSGIKTVAPSIDWLKLNAVASQHRQIGIYANRMVVAAAPFRMDRKPFIPSRFYERLRTNPEWRDLRYDASYRHFVARFHTGLTFRVDRLGLFCDVEYSIHFGIRGVHSLCSIIRTDGTTLVVPTRMRVSESLGDLAGKVEHLTRQGQSFVTRLGASWLPAMDELSFWEYVTSLLQSLSVPAGKRNEMRRDKGLTRCATKLDLLLFLSRHLQSGPTFSTPDMLTLSQRLAVNNRYDQHSRPSSQPFVQTVRTQR